jgi:hypothetical protein
MPKHIHRIDSAPKEVIQKTAFIILFTDYIHGKTKFQIQDMVHKQVNYIYDHYHFQDIDIIGVFHKDSFDCIKSLPRNFIKVLNSNSEDTNEAYSVGLALNCTDAKSVCILHGMNSSKYDYCFDDIPGLASFVKLTPGYGSYICNFTKDELDIAIPATTTYKNWDGFCYISPKDFNYFSGLCLSYDKRNLLLCELINELMEKGRKVLVKQ